MPKPNNRESKPPMPWPVSFVLALIAAGLLVALLMPGMKWGLPSEERNRLTLGADRAKWHSPEMPQGEAESPWTAYPNYLPGGPERKGAAPRSAFNPIRSYHPDEYVFLKSLSGMRPGEFKFFPGFFAWPALQFYIVGGALKTASLFGMVTLKPDLDYYFQNPGEMARLYLVGRWVTLVMAVGCVLLFWRAGTELFFPSAGAAAAFLLAAMPLFTVNARYLTADVPMLFWLCGVLFFSVRILKGGTIRTYVIAGIFLGLATATRYQGALGAFMIASAHLLRPEAEGARWRRFLRSRNLWIAALVSVLVFIVLNPYILKHPVNFWREVTQELGSSNAAGVYILQILTMIETGLGFIMAAGTASAILLALVRRDRVGIFILLAFGVPAVLLAAGRPEMLRYYMPVAIMPPLLLIYGFAVFHLRGREIGKKSTRAAAPVLAAIVIAATGLQSWAFSQLYSNPQMDTRTEAGKYIAESIKQGATIGVISEPWQFELPPMDQGKYHIVVAAPTEEGLLAERPDVIVTSDLQFQPVGVRETKSDELAFWTEVRNGGSEYRIARKFEAWPLGQAEFLRSGPHDLRYANPVIIIAIRK